MDFLTVNLNPSGKKKPVYHGRSGGNSKIKNVKRLKRVIPELTGAAQDSYGVAKKCPIELTVTSTKSQNQCALRVVDLQENLIQKNTA